MHQVIPSVTEKDIEDDNGQRTASLPAIEGEGEEDKVYRNSRMFTIEQIHQLFHLLLRRSKVRARLDVNDEETRDARERIAELERWRIELEERWEKRH